MGRIVRFLTRAAHPIEEVVITKKSLKNSLNLLMMDGMAFSVSVIWGALAVEAVELEAMEAADGALLAAA